MTIADSIKHLSEHFYEIHGATFLKILRAVKNSVLFKYSATDLMQTDFHLKKLKKTISNPNVNIKNREKAKKQYEEIRSMFTEGSNKFLSKALSLYKRILVKYSDLTEHEINDISDQIDEKINSILSIKV